jgi:putative hydrolase of the HAD superfamily
LIKAVFFDAGETLLHPQPSWSDICVEVLTERGHSVTIDAMRAAWAHSGRLFVESSNEGRTFSLSREESRAFWTKLYADLLEFLGIDDAGVPDKLYKTFSTPERYGLFLDVLPTLKQLDARGLRLGVISNFESWLSELLDHLGVSHRFETVAISGDLGWEKPDRRNLHWPMGELGVDAADCLHFGDSPDFDAGPAHELGMTGVLLDRHGRWNELEAAYPRVSSLGELPALLDGI